MWIGRVMGRGQGIMVIRKGDRGIGGQGDRGIGDSGQEDKV